MSKNANTKARFKLRSVFLFVNLTVLFLPLLGVIFFRFYENQLVKQTETELISQAAVFSAIYKENLKEELGTNWDQYGLLLNEQEIQIAEMVEEYYTPVEPQIDLFAGDIFPPRPDGVNVDVSDTPPDTMIADSGDDNDEMIVAAARVKREAAPSPPPAAAAAPLDIEESRVDVIQLSPQVVEDDIARKVGADMLPIIVEAQKTTLSGIKILDYQGIAVAGRNEVGLNFSLLTEIQMALGGNYTSLMRERISDEPQPAIASLSRGTGIRLFIAFPIVEGDRLWGVAYLSRTPQNILKHIYSNKENMTLIGLSLLALTLALALLTSYTISKPMNRLIARVKRFTDGELEAIEPMTDPGVIEIEQLSESFSNMATALNNRAHYIREFAMSVSHEFKTPITSIQGSAELLLEHVDDMTAEKKEKFLANIITDSDRLKRLINRLLELARADNFKPGNETASLNASLSAMKERYRDLKVEIDIDDVEESEILVAKEHLETILTNLFDNAMQHDADKISVTTESQYGFISLIINDNGSGISEANRAKIFDSFFTTKRENGGTGLGLGIVSSLLNAHNGAIELMDGEEGATFKITLPVTIHLNE